ncbi:carboxymuconolactone decarboxylase family protein [Streptomyces sp. URMC 123]|uniref:carboxymuconolactone decarboxylase family protein n=1 Tax=Streptomyces sp. URMC 123 TaxID=3423403 RepID=UPI003F1B8765
MARIPYPETPSDALTRLPAPLNIFRMLSHAPALTGPAIDLALALLGTTSLSPRTREMVIMTVAARSGCAYQAAQHAPMAAAVGVTPAQLTAIAEQRPAAGLFDESEAAALTATAELLASRTLRAGTVASLRRHYGEREIVELTLLVGYYVMVAGVMNALDVDLDPSGEHFVTLAGGSAPRGATPPGATG